MEKVFGCREKGTEGIGENTPVAIRIVRSHPALPLLKEGEMLRGMFFKESLELLSPGAEVVGEFEDGSPAIVANRYGQGWAIFAGSMLSLAFYRLEDEATGRVLKGLPELVGIDPPVLVSGLSPGADLEPCLLDGQDAQGRPYAIFFAFNHSPETVSPRFGLQVTPGASQVTDFETGLPVPFTWEDGRLVLETSLPAEGIWVVKITG